MVTREVLPAWVHPCPMRSWRRPVSVAVGFVLPLVVVYELFVSTQPVHHDLSDAGTGLLGLLLGVVAGLLGVAVALYATRKPPH